MEVGKLRSTKVVVPLRVGRRVMICGKHPWRQHLGQVVETNCVTGIGMRFDAKVKLDNGHECYANSDDLICTDTGRVAKGGRS